MRKFIKSCFVRQNSLLFTCLQSAGGGNVDPSVFIMDDGRPVRHPLINPATSKTPYSKDMHVGLMWCLFTMENKPRALELITKVINYGRDNGFRPNATWGHPKGISYNAADSSFYVADTGNSIIRKIDADGNVTTLSISGSLSLSRPERSLSRSLL